MGMKKMLAADVKYIAVHCAATKASQDIGATEIDRWHRAKGWIMIGYHFVIKRDGTVEKGRALDMPGAHVNGFNSVSLGICLVGGLDAAGKSENNFTKAQLAALTKLLATLARQFPAASVQGHRDFPGVKKDCPCFDVRSWLKTVSW
jgi:hypothetical protein